MSHIYCILVVENSKASMPLCHIQPLKAIFSYEVLCQGYFGMKSYSKEHYLPKKQHKVAFDLIKEGKAMLR